MAVTDDAGIDPSVEPPVVPAPVEEPPRAAKALTIGAVCKGLQQEYPDISISKIRYLEDQKLITPRRTPGGYRLRAVRLARLPRPLARSEL